MKNVLVTGCTGLLGSNICFNLKDRFKMTGLARGKFNMDSVKYVKGDFTDDESMRALFEKEKYDAVVHCAAITNVDLCEREKELAIKVNCSASEELAKIASDNGAQFIFISTDAVFSGGKDGYYLEEDKTDPINVYGATKAHAEELIQNIDNSLIVRTNMYGYNYLVKNSLSEWVVSALTKEETIDMFDDVLFSPLLVNDIAAYIGTSIEKRITGLLHFTSTDSMSKYEFGTALKDEFDLPGTINRISVDDFDFEAARSKNMRLNNARAQKTLDVHFPTMLDGIKALHRLSQEGYQSDLRGEL